ncbi:MAG: HAD hydrolase-like protein [Deltaproteobacteria bacterium]|nr:HAD hydrolase-like protein [Deltaproteobacteria bacterium]
MKKTIICIDRDGTLIYDERDHLYLGRDDHWKSKVKILPYVIDGLTLLMTIPDSAIYMITNQPGVAIIDYPLLTFERTHQVCTHVVDELKSMGGRIDGYFLCPHATPGYVKTKPGVNFDEKLVHECTCLKPNLGMVFDALKAENIAPDDAHVYVIGDRATDVQTALNINGIGILVPFENEPGEDEKVKKLEDQTRIYIAHDLLDAAGFIVAREK